MTVESAAVPPRCRWRRAALALRAPPAPRVSNTSARAPCSKFPPRARVLRQLSKAPTTNASLSRPNTGTRAPHVELRAHNNRTLTKRTTVSPHTGTHGRGCRPTHTFVCIDHFDHNGHHRTAWRCTPPLGSPRTTRGAVSTRGGGGARPPLLRRRWMPAGQP